jgi:hypothetical protein
MHTFTRPRGITFAISASHARVSCITFFTLQRLLRLLEELRSMHTDELWRLVRVGDVDSVRAVLAQGVADINMPKEVSYGIAGKRFLF